MNSDIIYIEHINDSIIKIFSYTKEMELDDFLQNQMIQDAVIRNFEIIGEATKNLTSDFKLDHSDIPWKEIAGMRDVLIHDYMGVDLWSVWETIKNYLPELKLNIDNILTK